MFLHPLSLHAQGGVPLWTNLFDGVVAYALAVDGSGNVFVAGISDNGSNSDYTTIGYSGAGAPLWTNRYNGPGNSNDVVTAIATDSSGNVIVTGYSHNGSGFQDYTTIKYSSAGVPVWTNRYHGPSAADDEAAALAVDDRGNVFVTGFSHAGSGTDYGTIAYSEGGVPLWTNRYHGPLTGGGDQAKALAVDKSGNVAVTGYSYDSADNRGYATVAYSRTGIALWTNRYDSNGDGQAQAVAADNSGDFIVTGFYDNFSGTNLYDYVTIKYSGAGVPLWTNIYNGPGNGFDTAKAVAVDLGDNVFVTGGSGDANGDYATIKYSSAGAPLWTNRYNGPENTDDTPSGIAVDSGGNVFVTGYSYLDDETIGYSGAGVALWTNLAGGVAVAVDRSGNVFVVGIASSGYETIKYSSVIPASPRLDFQKLSNQLVMSWSNAGFTLQSATEVAGTFTNMPNATSPFTNLFTEPRRFFRLMGN